MPHPPPPRPASNPAHCRPICAPGLLPRRVLEELLRRWVLPRRAELPNPIARLQDPAAVARGGRLEPAQRVQLSSPVPALSARAFDAHTAGMPAQHRARFGVSMRVHCVFPATSSSMLRSRVNATLNLRLKVSVGAPRAGTRRRVLHIALNAGPALQIHGRCEARVKMIRPFS